MPDDMDDMEAYNKENGARRRAPLNTSLIRSEPLEPMYIFMWYRHKLTRFYVRNSLWMPLVTQLIVSSLSQTRVLPTCFEGSHMSGTPGLPDSFPSAHLPRSSQVHHPK